MTSGNSGVSCVKDVRDHEYFCSFSEIPHPKALSIILEDTSTAERWSSSYDDKYILKMTKRAGSLKQFDIFVKMVRNAFKKASSAVQIELCERQDLMALRTLYHVKGIIAESTIGSCQISEDTTGKSKSYNWCISFDNYETVPNNNILLGEEWMTLTPPQIEDIGLEETLNRKYILMAYRAEYDNVLYVLPLDYTSSPNISKLVYITKKLTDKISPPPCQKEQKLKNKVEGKKDLNQLDQRSIAKSSVTNNKTMSNKSSPVTAKTTTRVNTNNNIRQPDKNTPKEIPATKDKTTNTNQNQNSNHLVKEIKELGTEVLRIGETTKEIMDYVSDVYTAQAQSDRRLEKLEKSIKEMKHKIESIKIYDDKLPSSSDFIATTSSKGQTCKPTSDAIQHDKHKSVMKKDPPSKEMRSKVGNEVPLKSCNPSTKINCLTKPSTSTSQSRRVSRTQNYQPSSPGKSSGQKVSQQINKSTEKKISTFDPKSIKRDDQKDKMTKSVGVQPVQHSTKSIKKPSGNGRPTTEKIIIDNKVKKFNSYTNAKVDNSFKIPDDIISEILSEISDETILDLMARTWHESEGSVTSKDSIQKTLYKSQIMALSEDMKEADKYEDDSSSLDK